MKNKFVQIGDYILDVVLSEEHTFESEVTDYPVESGGSFTDNIRPKPMKLTVEGIITNHPLTSNLVARGQVGGIAFGTSNTATAPVFQLFTELSGVEVPPVTILRSDQAYVYLRHLWKSRDVFTVRTSLGNFSSMALVSVSMPRSADTGDAIRFTAQFQQVLTVTNTRLTTAERGPGRGQNKRGPKATTPTPGTLVKWNRGIPAGGDVIYETVYVEFKVEPISEAPAWWYPSQQPISLARVNFAPGAGTYQYGNLYENPTPVDRKLNAMELKGFYADLARDSRRAAATQSIIDRATIRRFGSNEDAAFADLTRKPKGDMSAQQRKVVLRDGSGFDPLTTAVTKKPRNLDREPGSGELNPPGRSFVRGR